MITLDGSKGITSPGDYQNSTFTGTYTDGVVVDYSSPLGRISVGTSDGLAFYNGGVATTELMRLDASGNLGLGVTPSAWTSNIKAIQFGATGAVAQLSTNSAVNLTNNFYYNGTSNLYITSNYAST